MPNKRNAFFGCGIDSTSRDAPHLFGLSLKEMLVDEITTDLRNIRAQAKVSAQRSGHAITSPLVSKGISAGLSAWRRPIGPSSSLSEMSAA